MKRLICLVISLALIPATAPHAASGATYYSAPQLQARLLPHNVVVTAVTHEGRAAVGLRASPGLTLADGDAWAALASSDFRDGVIEVDVAAETAPGSDDTIRAFAGLGFRLSNGAYEAFYLRMLNGRAPDQVQRNHSAQYISHPEYGWARLRREVPGRYESYVDLAPGRWTHMRITVCGAEATLHIGGAAQPTLVVHDLKHGPAASGNLALWVGPGTLAQFANPKVTPAQECEPPRN